MSQKTLNVHIGIDISKEKLDIFILETSEHFRIPNNKKSLEDFCNNLAYPIELIAFEHSGSYGWDAIDVLKQLQIPFHVAHAMKVRSFAKYRGFLAKTDKIDAKILSIYASESHISANFVKSRDLRILQVLSVRRDQLRTMIEAEKKRRDSVNGLLDSDNYNNIINALLLEKSNIEDELDKAITSDARLAKIRDELIKIKSVGRLSANLMIALLPEIGSLNREEIAALVGLAPLNRDSGGVSGYRFTRGGRSMVRKVIYMLALVGTRHNIVLKELYSRLLDKGKCKKKALVAVMRKLLTYMNSTARNALSNI